MKASEATRISKSYLTSGQIDEQLAKVLKGIEYHAANGRQESLACMYIRPEVIEYLKALGYSVERCRHAIRVYWGDAQPLSWYSRISWGTLD